MIRNILCYTPVVLYFSASAISCSVWSVNFLHDSLGIELDEMVFSKKN
jgi:hypothetical protein